MYWLLHFCFRHRGFWDLHLLVGDLIFLFLPDSEAAETSSSVISSSSAVSYNEASETSSSSAWNEYVVLYMVLQKNVWDEIHLGTNLFPKNHGLGLTQSTVNLDRSHELEFFPKTKSAWFVVLKWRICQGITLALITHVIASKSLKKFSPIAAKTDDQKSTKMAGRKWKEKRKVLKNICN